MMQKADYQVAPLPERDFIRQATRVESGDAASGTSTSATMSVGDRFEGRLSVAGDTDWIGIDLVAGQSYVFTVFGTGGRGVGLEDSILRLRTETGSAIATNDDAFPGVNVFSAIEFTATSSGRYYLEVSGFWSNLGSYTVQAATDVYTPEQIASQLVEFNWGFPAILAHDESAGVGSITYNIEGLTAAGQQLATWAFEVWAATTGLVFQRTTGSAEITVDDNRSGAFAGPDSVSDDGTINSASVNVGIDWLQAYGTTFDSYSFLTYLHEIGHALGLGHSGEYDGSASYALGDYLYRNDSYQMSIMSYFDVSANTFVDGVDGLPVTPMIADLVAMGWSYGATAFTGNTVWGANNNLGGILGQVLSMIVGEAPVNTSILAGGTPLMFTVVDTGGTDTLDLSHTTVGNRVNMNGGTLSDLAGERNVMGIAVGTVLENFVGGSGADTVTGNSASNSFIGGLGNDSIDGGGGTDTAQIGAAFTAVSVSVSNGVVTITSANGIDRFTNIESFVFSDRTLTLSQLTSGGSGGSPIVGTPARDVLLGTPLNDSMQGLGGDDRIDAGEGSDTIEGGNGHDEILARGGNDSVLGGLGNDNIAGADGDDTIYGDSGGDALGGGNGNDVLYGGTGRDVIGGGSNEDLIYGDDGNDTMSGGWGRDTLYGGEGDDELAGSFDNDRVFGGNGHDNIGGGTGADVIYGGSGNDSIGAGDDDDLIFGELGDDFLGGGSGGDQLFGNAGADRLNGGSGNDTLTGGADADRFIFSAFTPGEVDRVADWVDGQDLFQMHGIAGASNAARFAALSISTVSGGVSISYGGHTITVDGASVGQLSEADFIFV